MGKIQGALTGTGLNLNFTSKGVSGSFGSGSDIGLMAGMASLYKGLSTRDWAAKEYGANSDTYQSIGKVYTYGDSAALATIARLKKGVDTLQVGSSQGIMGAQTIASEDGGRQITIGGYGNADSLAVMLAHEAHRDGYSPDWDSISDIESRMQAYGEQSKETYKAVLAHTQLARKLAQDGGAGIFADQIGIQTDLAMLKRAEEVGMEAFAEYVGGAYDSSKDYWKLTNDGKLVNDGSGWLRDENGKYISTDGTKTDRPIPGLTVGAGGIETGLLNILFGGTSNKGGFSEEEIRAVQELMIASGMVHSVDPDNPTVREEWYWGGVDRATGQSRSGMTPGLIFGIGSKEVVLDAHNYGQTLNMESVMDRFGDVIDTTVFNSYYLEGLTNLARDGDVGSARSPFGFLYEGAGATRFLETAQAWSGVYDSLEAYIGAGYYSSEINERANSPDGRIKLDQMRLALAMEPLGPENPFFGIVGENALDIKPFPGMPDPDFRYGVRVTSDFHYYDSVDPDPDAIDGDHSRTRADQNWRPVSSLAVDFGVAVRGQTDAFQPVYATTDSYFDLSSSFYGSQSRGLGWWNQNNHKVSYGIAAMLRTDDLDFIYGHLAERQPSTRNLEAILTRASDARMPRVYIPAGLQLGNMGNTGNSFGNHTHFEVILRGLF